jgi:hypothetical protein
LKEISVCNIKRLSHTGKKKEEVTAWVENNFPGSEQMTTFVQGIPLVVIEFITRGVAEFGK